MEPTHWQDGIRSVIHGICVGTVLKNSLWGTSELRLTGGYAERTGAPL